MGGLLAFELHFLENKTVVLCRAGEDFEPFFSFSGGDGGPKPRVAVEGAGGGCKHFGRAGGMGLLVFDVGMGGFDNCWQVSYLEWGLVENFFGGEPRYKTILTFQEPGFWGGRVVRLGHGFIAGVSLHIEKMGEHGGDGLATQLVEFLVKVFAGVVWCDIDGGLGDDGAGVELFLHNHE